MVSGGLLALTSLLYACKEVKADTTYTIFLALAFTVLSVLGILLRSFALYTGAVIAIIVWYGIFSAGQGSDNLFLGMNYPLRYTVFGACILLLSLLQRWVKPGYFTGDINYFTGLILFFTGLWALSVFGNYNTLAQWHIVRQIHVLAYAILFAAAAATSFIAGIRYRDPLARDMGVLFLLINLYTRYFEYFWDSMNKGIFFLVLAITCGFLGWWLDKGKSFRRHKNTRGA